MRSHAVFIRMFSLVGRYNERGFSSRFELSRHTPSSSMKITGIAFPYGQRLRLLIILWTIGPETAGLFPPSTLENCRFSVFKAIHLASSKFRPMSCDKSCNILWNKVVSLFVLCPCLPRLFFPPRHRGISTGRRTRHSITCWTLSSSGLIPFVRRSARAWNARSSRGCR